MNSEILVIGWEGYGASSRKDHKTLSDPTMREIQGRNDDIPIRFHEVASNDKDESMEEVKKMIQLINPAGVLLEGKSYGCVRIKQFTEEYWDDILKGIEYNIELIDPHGAMLGDGEVGPYCDRQPMRLDNIKAGTKIKVICQQKDKPTGATVPEDCGDVENIILDGFDHYNIINAWAVKEKFHELMDDLVSRIAIY